MKRISPIPSLAMAAATLILAFSLLAPPVFAQNKVGEIPLAPSIEHKSIESSQSHSSALQGGVTSIDAAAGSSSFRINVGAARSSNIANFLELPPVTGKAHSERVDPLVFRAWLSKAHPQFSLTASSENSVVVEVGGQWDKADKTLNKFQIPFKHIKTRDISSEILANNKVLIINCAGDVKRDKLQAIRDFVSRGGYLLTTDWALDNMLSQTFPGYVSWNKGVNKKDIYDAEYLSPDPVLANNTVRNAFWKLDQASHTVHVANPGAVHILAVSRDLAGEDPDHAGILALVFPFGKGYVLHMVGHFDNNAKIAIGNFLPDPAPAIGISLRQAIAANFIVAGIEGKRLPY